MNYEKVIKGIGYTGSVGSNIEIEMSSAQRENMYGILQTFIGMAKVLSGEYTDEEMNSMTPEELYGSTGMDLDAFRTPISVSLYDIGEDGLIEIPISKLDNALKFRIIFNNI